MKEGALKKTPVPSERQVRAVGVCRPPGASDSRRLSTVAAVATSCGALAELDISNPAAASKLAPNTPDADLFRDIAVGKDGALRMPLYGHLGADVQQLCEREVAPLLRHLLAGESAAVIAYGQTGSGKSYTMGTEKYEEGQGPGPHSVSAFCAEGVFALARESGVKELEVSLAAIEIYREGKDKERLFDLQTLERKRIESFEQQASWQHATSAQDLQRKLLDASFVRNTDRTDGNARSSRSHAIFVTQVQFKRRQEEGGWQRIKARLMLVDLAGSERTAAAEGGSANQKQGSGINVGLLFLGMIINELAERGETKNYAFSCLTKILKPALGGGSNEVTSSCNTLILGCINPLTLHLANTRSTLEFLQSAGTVKNVVKADVQMLRQQELAAELEDLRRQVRELLLKQPQFVGGSGRVAAGAGAAAGGACVSPGSQHVPLGSHAGESETAADGGAAAAVAEERVAALEAEVASLRKALVVERDRADAYEGVLRQQESVAVTAAAAATQAASMPAGILAAAAAATPGTSPGAAPAAPPAPPSSAAGTAAANPLMTMRLSAALQAASPLLAASREVAEWVADAAAVQAATPAGERVPLLRLLPGVEDVCCERQSHMELEQLAALKGKVERLLDSVQEGDDREQALVFAEACLYSVLAYNKCLGDAVTRAEDAAEDLQAAMQQHEHEFSQLYQEKVQYMRRTAAAEGGLSEYETQVEELVARLAAAQKALQQQAEAQQGTPGRWGSLARLLSGGGRSPAASTSPGGAALSGDSRRSSESGFPAISPRLSGSGGGASLQQQLFGSPSPSRLGQQQQPWQHKQQQDGQPEQASGAGSSVRRITVASVQYGEVQPAPLVATAADAVALASKQQQALAALLSGGGEEGQGHEPLIKAVGRHSETACLAPAVVPALPEQLHAMLSRQPLVVAGKQQLEQEQQEQAAQEAEEPLLQELQEGGAQRVGAQQQAGASCRPQDMQLRSGAGSSDVETPLESPELSCITAGSSNGGGGNDGPGNAGLEAGAPHAGAVAAAPAGPEAAGQSAGPADAEMAEAEQQQQAEQELPLALSGQQPEAQQAQPAARPPLAAAPPAEQLSARAGMQQPAQPFQPASMKQHQEQLPGRCISVLMPLAATGRGQGRGRSAAVFQEYDFCPATGGFMLPGNEASVDPLKDLCKVLPEGEPWQRHVLLKAPSSSGLSGITLERWLARRMLCAGRCHFCCRTEPDPGVRHPEVAFGELRLCGDCHSALEPEIWRMGKGWHSSDPSNPGLLYCCMCGTAGVGSTDELIMCSACKLCGFCSGCLWRFTLDELAAVREDACFVCLICRPQSRLQLLYVEESDTSPVPQLHDSRSGTASRSGSSHGASQDAAQGRQAVPAAGGVGTRRGCWPRQACQQAQMPEEEFSVDQPGPSSTNGSGSEETSDEEGAYSNSNSIDKEYEAPSSRCNQPAAHQRQPGHSSAPATAEPKQRAGAQPPRRQKALAGTQAAAGVTAAAAAAAKVQSQPPPAVTARKRNRLLAKGDLVSSPVTVGEHPALQHQRLAQAQGCAAANSGRGGDMKASQPSLSTHFRDLLHL